MSRATFVRRGLACIALLWGGCAAEAPAGAPAEAEVLREGETQCNKFAAATQWIDNLGPDHGWTEEAVRVLGDLNGDRRDDLVTFAAAGTFVSLSTGEGFSEPSLWVEAFGAETGWDSDDPRVLADVNGDGLQDILGFGHDGVYVSVSTAAGLQSPEPWVEGAFGRSEAAGSWSNEHHIRTLADINADGLPDIVGFGALGVEVAMATGNGFDAPKLWLEAFGSEQGWGAQSPRMLADVDGDGRADVIGFAPDGVYLSRATPDGLEDPDLVLEDFSADTGEFTSPTLHPRTTADVNGDGKADLVGFNDDGVYVALATTEGFSERQLWSDAFRSTQPWPASSLRQLADVNHDGLADVIGVHHEEVWVAVSDGESFVEASVVSAPQAADAGFPQLHRLADVDGDSAPDVVAFRHSSVEVVHSNCPVPNNASIAIGRGGYVETDISTAEFMSSDFTVSLWFMPQWTRGNRQPLIASAPLSISRSDFSVELLRHRAPGNGDQPQYGVVVPDDELGQPALGTEIYVSVSGIGRTYVPSPALTKNHWYHLAVTMQGAGCDFEVYLNGVALSPVYPGQDLACQRHALDPSYTLLLGSETPGVLWDYGSYPANAFAYRQFYGLIDDLAVFDRAMSPLAIGALIAARRLRGDEVGLIAGLTFDPSTPLGPLPPHLSRPTTPKTYKPALPLPSIVPTSEDRDDAADIPRLPAPAHTTDFQLPFAPYDVWYVNHGYGWPDNVRQDWACQTFVRPVGPYLTGVYAAADGATIVPFEGTAGAVSGRIMQVHGPSEHSVYRTAAPGFPQQTGSWLAAGDFTALAGMGSEGAELRFCTVEADQSPPTYNLYSPFPAAFSNYEWSASASGPWTAVARGVPQPGTWVRRVQ